MDDLGNWVFLFAQHPHGREAVHVRRLREEVRAVGREEEARQGALQGQGSKEDQAATAAAATTTTTTAAAAAAAATSPPSYGRGRRRN